LAENIEDLKTRLARIVVGTDTNNDPSRRPTERDRRAGDAAQGRARPNLVQTIEGTPAILHGGPFANIAHGCNSVLATRMALKLGDVCVTERGSARIWGPKSFWTSRCANPASRPMRPCSSPRCARSRCTAAWNSAI
jgi:formate--tetrahydrofolate ligase